jgi:hypothetical protein
MKVIVGIVLMGIVMCIPHPSIAAGSGTIDSTDYYAWSENLGWISFGTETGDVRVSDTQLTGYAWNDRVGWIELYPTNDVYVHNSPEGRLSGFGWGPSVGYIDFSGVTIDGAGYFRGYAYSTTTGRISFTCENTGSCDASSFRVRTNWRPVASMVTDQTGYVSHSSEKKGPLVTTFSLAERTPSVERFAQLISTPSLCPYFLTTLGADEEDTLRLQRFLRAYTGEDTVLETGVYDSETRAGLEHFQAEQNVRDESELISLINYTVCGGVDQLLHSTAIPVAAAVVTAIPLSFSLNYMPRGELIVGALTLVLLAIAAYYSLGIRRKKRKPG